MSARKEISFRMKQIKENQEQIGGFVECIIDLNQTNEELRAEVATIRKGEAQNQ